jgi:hypothetical protein
MVSTQRNVSKESRVIHLQFDLFVLLKVRPSPLSSDHDVSGKPQSQPKKQGNLWILGREKDVRKDYRKGLKVETR